MEDLIKFGLLSLTSFITLVNPLSVMPLFMTMTADLNEASRVKTARKAILTSFLTMLAFALSGQLLFQFFNISVDSFRVVGGIIFFMMGQDMLQARLSRVKVDEESVKQYVTDISITPLAIPMICGPGAITNSIVLMEDANDLPKKGILIASMLVVNFLTYLAMVGSGKISKLLGETGNKIMMRLMGLIVMVIAIEFMLNGLRPIVRDLLMIGK
jgi:multiple antibiotic resistance protein